MRARLPRPFVTHPVIRVANIPDVAYAAGTMAMFCPLCRVEYRDGFTRCSDCDVALVDHLPAAAAGGDPDAPTDAEGRELLWSGLSTRLYEAIRDALDAAGIPHTDAKREFGMLATFAETAHLIWIDPDQGHAARSMLEKVLADPNAGGPRHEAPNLNDFAWMDPLKVRREVYTHQSGPLEPAEVAESAGAVSGSEPLPNDLPEEFEAEGATVQVWSGDDAETAQFLKDSLSGVGIGCVVHEDGNASCVLVLPADQSRAKEIVREVVEGAPPE